MCPDPARTSASRPAMFVRSSTRSAKSVYALKLQSQPRLHERVPKESAGRKSPIDCTGRHRRSSSDIGTSSARPPAGANPEPHLVVDARSARFGDDPSRQYDHRSHGLWRSLVSAPDWGSGGREFESPQPDLKGPGPTARGSSRQTRLIRDDPLHVPWRFAHYLARCAETCGYHRQCRCSGVAEVGSKFG